MSARPITHTHVTRIDEGPEVSPLEVEPTWPDTLGSADRAQFWAGLNVHAGDPETAGR